MSKLTNDSPELRQWLTSKRPLNWDEMGSSAKDMWEERMTRSWERGYR
jgi:hypothetical protein